jgi:ABC-type transport system involved in cytochrome c biogenesis permease subunit
MSNPKDNVKEKRHRNMHAYMVLAFLTVLMTYFGVNYLLGGMHSYA